MRVFILCDETRIKNIYIYIKNFANALFCFIRYSGSVFIYRSSDSFFFYCIYFFDGDVEIIFILFFFIYIYMRCDFFFFWPFIYVHQTYFDISSVISKASFAFVKDTKPIKYYDIRWKKKNKKILKIFVI